MTPSPSQHSGLELALLIAARSFPRHIPNDEWKFGDELRGRLVRLGHDLSSQKVTAMLKRMCAEDAPRFERRDTPWRDKQYRLTNWGRNELFNTLPGLER
jgi:hypothetical protein